ncbi:MAG TPA: hypothetical protein VK912_08900 [Longimicrobiales bacterium]|nr:hypothetical protein [Longimicrobiales bacterium]
MTPSDSASAMAIAFELMAAGRAPITVVSFGADAHVTNNSTAPHDITDRIFIIMAP